MHNINSSGRNRGCSSYEMGYFSSGTVNVDYPRDEFLDDRSKNWKRFEVYMTKRVTVGSNQHMRMCPEGTNGRECMKTSLIMSKPARNAKNARACVTRNPSSRKCQISGLGIVA